MSARNWDNPRPPHRQDLKAELMTREQLEHVGCQHKWQMNWAESPLAAMNDETEIRCEVCGELHPENKFVLPVADQAQVLPCGNNQAGEAALVAEERGPAPLPFPIGKDDKVQQVVGPAILDNRCLDKLNFD